VDLIQDGFMKLSIRTRRKVKISVVPNYLRISLQEEAQWEARGGVVVNEECRMAIT